MPQVGQLTMQAHEILFREFPMAITASPRQRFAKPDRFRIAQIVPPVTGRADRAFGRRAAGRNAAWMSVFALRLPAMNARLQPLLDKQMALPTCLNDVFAVQIGTLVGNWKGTMRIVAIRASSADR
jgi:hypothetical protein